MEHKQWYKSSTVWFNLAFILAAAINEAIKAIDIPAEQVTVLLSITNLILRFKTVLPIK